MVTLAVYPRLIEFYHFDVPFAGHVSDWCGARAWCAFCSAHVRVRGCLRGCGCACV